MVTTLDHPVAHGTRSS